MADWYILNDEHEALPVGYEEYSEWRSSGEPDNRRVARDERGDVYVSTVFLTIDHDFSGLGPPVLWETMVFGGEFDEEQERYTSHTDALAGHARWVEKALP